MAVERGAGRGMEAICPDQQMRVDVQPLGGDGAGAFARQVDAVDFRQKAEVPPRLARAFGQKVDQVGAVDEMPAHVGPQAGEVKAQDARAVEAVTQFHRFGTGGNGGKVKAERVQHRCTIGADLQARAHFADRVGLFQQRHGSPAQGQRTGDRKARHACPEDGYG